MFPKMSYRPIFLTKASKSSDIMEFHHCTFRKASLEIIPAVFRKCCLSNAHDGSGYDVVRDSENAGETTDVDCFSGSSDEDWVSGVKGPIKPTIR